MPYGITWWKAYVWFECQLIDAAAKDFRVKRPSPDVYQLIPHGRLTGFARFWPVAASAARKVEVFPPNTFIDAPYFFFWGDLLQSICPFSIRGAVPFLSRHSPSDSPISAYISAIFAASPKWFAFSWSRATRGRGASCRPSDTLQPWGLLLACSLMKLRCLETPR